MASFAHPNSASNPFPVPAKLRRLQVEVTTGCNLKCVGCPRTVAMTAKQWRNAHMPVSRFRRIVDHAPMAEAIVLQGVGEPTLHPSFPLLVEIAIKSGKFDFVSFNTNALARDIGYYRELARLGLRHLSVSVDALDQEGAELTRAGTDAALLQRQLIGLLQLFPGLTVSIVLSKMNLERFEPLLRQLLGLGVWMIEVQPLVSYADLTNPLCLTPADIRQALADMQKVRSDHAGQHILPAPGMTPNGQRCHRPLNAAYCTVDGYLTPCCVTNDTEYFARTSLENLSFKQAWESDSVGAWMAEFQQHEPEMCKSCGYNPSGFEPDSHSMNAAAPMADITVR
jgi:MoaA/NifB/PqqE/SkfB family radical SAM enzyme